MKTLGKILNGPFDEARKERRKQEIKRINNARARCKKLAAKLGVEIQPDNSFDGPRSYWLEGTGWDDDNYCSDWFEVEEKLNLLRNERGVS